MGQKEIRSIEPDWIARRQYRAEKRLENSIQARALEIGLFWQRSLFFWGFIASAFFGYAELRAAGSKLAIIVACFGMVCSFLWTLLNRGSKYWQESWEKKVNRNEFAVTGKLFSEIEDEEDFKGFWLRARKFSVSKITIALSDYVFILSLSIVIYELTRIFCPLQVLDHLKQHGLALFSIFSFVYLYAAIICSATKFYSDDMKKRKSPTRIDKFGVLICNLIMAKCLKENQKLIWAFGLFAVLVGFYFLAYSVF